LNYYQLLSKICLKLLNFLVFFIKKQFFFAVILFLVYVFYFKKTVGVAFNSSQPSILNFLSDKQSESLLMACNSSMDFLVVGLIFSASYLAYNYLATPIIIEPLKTVFVEKEMQVERTTQTVLSEAQQHSNSVSDHFISSFSLYQNHLNSWRLEMLKLKPHFGKSILDILDAHPDVGYDIETHISTHEVLHDRIVERINPDLVSAAFKERALIPRTSVWNRDVTPIEIDVFEFSKLPDIAGIVPLPAITPLSLENVAKLCKITPDEVGCLDYHWLIVERLNQSCGEKFIAINPIIVPETVISYTTEKVTSPVIVDAIIGSRATFFFLEAKKFFFSFFF